MDSTAPSNLVFVKYCLEDYVKAQSIIHMINIIMKINIFDPDIEIPAGAPFLRNMEKAIYQSQAYILFISKTFLKCRFCNLLIDSLVTVYCLTNRKCRIILIVLDYCKVPLFLKQFECIYYCKYEKNIQKYSMAPMDCFLPFMRRIVKALTGPRHQFRRIRPLKEFKPNRKKLSRLIRIIKRDCLKRGKQDSDVLNVLGLNRLVKISEHCLLSCKYGKCSFSCSGQNTRSFEKHLDKCKYIPVKCCNKQCTFIEKRKMMKKHSKECQYAMVKCSHPNCNVRTQRSKLNSHERQCSNRIVSCSFGCAKRVPYKDLHSHLKKCLRREHTYTTCNESTRYINKARHVCATGTNECPYCNKMFLMKDFQNHLESSLTKCKLCDERFPKIKHHNCLFLECPNEYFDYKGHYSTLRQHMNTCGFERKTCPNCFKPVISKNMKFHLSECETKMKCTNCGLRIDISQKTAHDLLYCIANDNRIPCQLCQKYVKRGSIKYKEDIVFCHEMHDKDRVINSADYGNATCQSNRNEINNEYLRHIVHTESRPIETYQTVSLKGLFCSKGRKRFQEILNRVDSNVDLNHEIRQFANQHIYKSKLY